MSDVQGSIFFSSAFLFRLLRSWTFHLPNGITRLSLPALALSSGAYPDIFIELIYVIFDLQLYFFHFLFLLMYVDSFQSHNNIALP